MKIAFFNLTFGAVNRGAETFVLEVSQRLRRLGNKVDVISSRQPYAGRLPFLWRAYLDPHGIQVLWFTLKNLKRIFREKYDVVVPIDGGWQPALVRIATWLYRGKMVISGQSGMGWDDRNNLWCFPDYFVALSASAEKWAKKAAPFAKVTHIPNGVDTNLFRPDGSVYETKLHHPIVLTVAALVESKYIDLVIRAVARLPRTSLLICGKGQEEGNLRKLADELLKGRFEMISAKYEDLVEIYRTADVFVLTPWEREAFGVVYLEAMATGLPVVARSDETRKDLVGDAGILVRSPENSEELAEAIEAVLHKNWGDAPRNQAEKFDWDNIAQKYKDLFKRLV